ncbi:hypothetical protein JOC54_000283 [Alkalihalobacillus xiaoxiensis]|uniref:Uncharacterized protein n=1 Tax=Shouchella xiaoxiensis TaxID=766895 RepID=A0ABS2SNF6_9BACI|nr:hypothetical protein [Shouchella xiaoxiensis]
MQFYILKRAYPLYGELSLVMNELIIVEKAKNKFS